MEVTKEEQRQYILDMLLPYKQDVSICGWDENDKSCVYFDSRTKNVCVAGKMMKDPSEFSYSDESILNLIKDYGRENLLNEEALRMNLPDEVIGQMQSYHDLLAKSRFISAMSVIRIEKITGFKLDELK